MTEIENKIKKIKESNIDEEDKDALIASYLATSPDTPYLFTKNYLSSLKKVQNLAIDMVLPSHGKVIKESQKLIAKSIDITYRRERKILEILKKEKKTVYQIVESLLGGKSEDFIIFFRYIGMVETYLKELVTEGRVKEIVSGNGRYYLLDA